MRFCAPLPHRITLRIGGVDRLSFLQNLLSNDIARASADDSVYAALLTPQGRFLHDLFILADGDSYLVDCERGEDLLRRLAAYKLRAKVTFENLADRFDVWAVWGEEKMDPRRSLPRTPIRGGDDGIYYTDPRLPELGARIFMPKGEKPVGEIGDYETHRLALGVTDARDMEIEKSTLAEGNFDFLNGIDWKKGCYIGQELTARMHYRGLAKRRLFPVRIDGAAPAPGTILDNNMGEMRSHSGQQGLALLKIDIVLEKTPITHGQTRLWPQTPDWLKLT